MPRQCLGYLNAKTTLFLMCDVQEKFRPAMTRFQPMVQNIQKLVYLKKDFYFSTRKSQSIFLFQCTADGR